MACSALMALCSVALLGRLAVFSGVNTLGLPSGGNMALLSVSGPGLLRTLSRDDDDDDALPADLLGDFGERMFVLTSSPAARDLGLKSNGPASSVIIMGIGLGRRLAGFLSAATWSAADGDAGRVANGTGGS